MKWIEIIELRSAGKTRRQSEAHLREFIEQIEKETEKQAVKLYSRIDEIVHTIRKRGENHESINSVLFSYRKHS